MKPAAFSPTDRKPAGEIKPGKTLIRLFEDSVKKYGRNPMFWEKNGKEYKSASYLEMRSRIYAFAAGLLQLGVKRDDKLALLAQAQRDWVTAEMGIFYAGGINVPLSVKMEGPELLFRLRHAGVKILIVSEYQYEKIRAHRAELPDLEKIILINGSEPTATHEYGFNTILQKGEEYLQSNMTAFRKSFDNIHENDCAIISYTSGTTADPKGIMLSHKNLYTNCMQSMQLFPIGEEFRTLLVLPLDHSFAHTAGMFVFIASGASLASVPLGKTPAATLKNLFGSIREIKPHALLSVPTVAKNMKKNIENGIRKKGRLIQFLFKTGLKLSYKYNGEGWNRGHGWRRFYAPAVWLFDKLICAEIRAGFGGRMQYFVGGGALLDMELQRFFYAIGIPMYQGYGLTEASPVISSNTVINHKLGSSGKVVPGLEVQIRDENAQAVRPGEQGEIVVKGDNIMLGYFRNKAASKESLRNGWLFTGDLGYFDEEDYLYVLGRSKSLLIGDDGEKYSPEGIEEYIEEHARLVKQIMIYNNQSPYTTALVYPDAENLATLLKKHHLSEGDAKGQEFIIRQLHIELTSNNHGKVEHNFPLRWLPASFVVLSEGFTEQNQLLNSTLKMVRSKIAARYSQEIEYLYTPEGKQFVNAKNKSAIAKLFAAK